MRHNLSVHDSVSLGYEYTIKLLIWTKEDYPCSNVCTYA